MFRVIVIGVVKDVYLKKINLLISSIFKMNDDRIDLVINSDIVKKELQRLLLESINDNKVLSIEDMDNIKNISEYSLDTAHYLYLGEYIAYLYDNPNEEREDEIYKMIRNNNIPLIDIMNYYYDYSTQRLYRKINYMIVRLSRNNPNIIPKILHRVRGKYYRVGNDLRYNFGDTKLYFEGVKDIIDKKKVEDYIRNHIKQHRAYIPNQKNIYILSLIGTDFSRMKEIFREWLIRRPDFLDEVILNQI